MEKHKKILKMYSTELELVRQQNFDLEQRLNQVSQQIVVVQRSEQDVKLKLEELTTALR